VPLQGRRGERGPWAYGVFTPQLSKDLEPFASRDHADALLQWRARGRAGRQDRCARSPGQPHLLPTTARHSIERSLARVLAARRLASSTTGASGSCHCQVPAITSSKIPQASTKAVAAVAGPDGVARVCTLCSGPPIASPVRGGSSSDKKPQAIPFDPQEPAGAALAVSLEPAGEVR
jgi:hypothetical protein